LEGGIADEGFRTERELTFAKRRMTVAEEKPEQLVRFDFPAGAAAEEIAEALNRARKRLMAEYAAKKKEKEPKKE
jgi:hypothetical protein